MNSSKRSNQQNVDNMEVLTEKVITFQPGYNPSESRLSVQNQKQVKASGDEVLLGVSEAERACDSAITARNVAFDVLDPFVTRLYQRPANFRCAGANGRSRRITRT